MESPSPTIYSVCMSPSCCGEYIPSQFRATSVRKLENSMTFWFLIGSDVQLKQGAESDVSCATIRGGNVRNLMMDSPLRGTYWRNSENVRGSKHMYFVPE
jgi:hypothetical protein